MIIRVMGEGQYRVDSGLFDTLNQIDNSLLMAEVETGGDEGVATTAGR